MLNKAIYQTITDEIIYSIKNKELAPGSRIPSIKDIKKKYDVSQITALRVFKELTASGYVNKKIGSGYYVADVKISPTADFIISCVHPPRAINNRDNWGSRIVWGIVQECLEYRMGLLHPPFAGVFRDGALAPAGPAEIAAGISAMKGYPAGVLLDYRLTDEDIKKYILPSVGNIPVVIVGRKSELPVISVSLPGRAGARDAALLSIKVGYRNFIICKHANYIYSNDLCGSFVEALAQEEIYQKNILVLDDVFSGHERDNQVLDIIEKNIKSSSEKLLVFTASDSIGRFVVDRLQERGIVWGRNAGLVSFGGKEITYNSNPRLATVAMSPEQLGRMAIKALMQYPATLQRDYVIDYKIDINDTF